jgi:DNA polymerase-1
VKAGGATSPGFRCHRPQKGITLLDKPVRPAIDGTYPFPDFLKASFTAGSSVTTRRVLSGMLSRALPITSDIETFGLDGDARRIKCVTMSNGEYAVLLDARNPEDQHTIRTVYREARHIVFHNSAFDVPNLYVAGLIDLADVAKIIDTIIYARLAFPDLLAKKDLDSLAHKLLGWTTEETTKQVFRRLGYTIAEGYRLMDIDSPLYIMGACIDSIATARLVEPLRRACLDTITTGHPFTTYGVTGDEAHRLIEREQILNRMSLRRACRGLRVDFDFLDQYVSKTAAGRAAAEAGLIAEDIRTGNAGDLIKVLERDGMLPEDWPRTKTGRASTTAANLETLTYPVAELFVRAKHIAKIQDDYLSKVTELADEHGRIHPVLSYLKATTGRAAYGTPPLHQFPEDARGIILADEGDQLTSIDWSQIEPVIVAYIAGEHGVLTGYEAGTSDLYQDLGARAGIGRKIAKVTLLAQLYGEGLAKLAGDLKLAGGVEEARELREFIFRTMPKVKRLLYKLRDIGEQYRCVFTLSGRIVPVPMGKGFDGGPPQVATHKAVNYFVQGSAYDVLAEGLLEVDRAGLGDAVYLSMHDEILCSTSAAGDVQKIMQTPPARLIELAGRVPVLRTDRADLGDRWAAA